jgi:hypothetical protein
MVRGVQLQARDIALLEFLLDRKVATLDTLHQALFPARIRKGAANRLGELARAGYITRIPAAHVTADGQVLTVYRLGPKAPAALRQFSLAARSLDDLALRPIHRLSIPRQLVVNQVADWLGTSLNLPRHDHGARGDEPDGAYLARDPDHNGRRVVLVQLDLGNPPRERVLDTVRAFFSDPDARSLIYATPSTRRANLTANWIRNAYGENVMNRIQPLSFAELEHGGLLDRGTEPSAAGLQLRSFAEHA